MTKLTRRRFAQALALSLPLGIARFAESRTSVPAFGPASTAEEVTRGLDLSGKAAVVTGCNSGIGQEVMRVLALRGAHVIGTARTLDKGRTACAAIRGRATPVQLDLGDLESVVRCSEQIAALGARIDMLICNAGIVLGQHEQIRGLEKQFAVNHLGHFLLTHRLLDRITAAPQGRVVVVGSNDHRNAPAGGIQFDSLSGDGWFSKGYGHSKLANGLFSLELARRLAKSNATSNCATPGHTRTNILRNVSTEYRSDARSVAQGAATICYVAAHPGVSRMSGMYFKDCALTESSPYQRDQAMATRLWKVSEELTREYLKG